jgi:hypothetical protein
MEDFMSNFAPNINPIPAMSPEPDVPPKNTTSANERLNGACDCSCSGMRKSIAILEALEYT